MGKRRKRLSKKEKLARALAEEKEIWQTYGVTGGQRLLYKGREVVVERAAKFRYKPGLAVLCTRHGERIPVYLFGEPEEIKANLKSMTEELNGISRERSEAEEKNAGRQDWPARRPSPQLRAASHYAHPA